MKHLIDDGKNKCFQLSLSMVLGKHISLGFVDACYKYHSIYGPHNLRCHRVFNKFRSRVIKVLNSRRVAFGFCTLRRYNRSIESSWNGRGMCRVGYKHTKATHMVAYENGIIYCPNAYRPIIYKRYFNEDRYVIHKKRLR